MCAGSTELSLAQRGVPRVARALGTGDALVQDIVSAMTAGQGGTARPAPPTSLEPTRVAKDAHPIARVLGMAGALFLELAPVGWVGVEITAPLVQTIFMEQNVKNSAIRT